jgi:predicted nucleic acid-binding protein
MTGTSTRKGGRIADTSFLYALFSENDRFHGEATREVEQRGLILIPPEIFAETIALIHYRQGFAAAGKSGRWLGEQRGVGIRAADDSYIGAAWKVFLAGRGQLSYPDSIVVAWCRKLRASPLAHDNQLKGAI